jgi:hypothetical protein
VDDRADGALGSGGGGELMHRGEVGDINLLGVIIIPFALEGGGCGFEGLFGEIGNNKVLSTPKPASYGKAHAANTNYDNDTARRRWWG